MNSNIIDVNRSNSPSSDGFRGWDTPLPARLIEHRPPVRCRSRNPSLFLHLVSSISLQNSRVYHRILSRGTYTHLSRGTLCRPARPLGARHCPHTTVHGMQDALHARFGAGSFRQPKMLSAFPLLQHLVCRTWMSVPGNPRQSGL